jgi:hypothetical protein
MVRTTTSVVLFEFYLFGVVVSNALADFFLQTFCDDVNQVLPSLKTRLQVDGSMFRTLRVHRTEVLVLSHSMLKAK